MIFFHLDEAYKSNIRDKSRKSERSQIQRDRESRMVYHPKVNNEKESKSASEKATFKSHMFSQKERERKTSSTTSPYKNDDNETIDDFVSPAIPPTVAPLMMKTPLACLTYNTRVPWKLRVKKEVFRPNESIGPPAVIDLLFAQILTDTFGPCLRISQPEKRQAMNFLNSHSIDLENFRSQSRSIKRQMIDIARSWPFYFSRLFIVTGTSPQFSDVSILAVNHNGVYLARKENEVLMTCKSIPFGELQNVVSSFIIINKNVSDGFFTHR